MTVSPDPSADYHSRLRDREAQRDQFATRDTQFANARLVVFALLLAALWWAWGPPGAQWLIAMAIGGGFVALLAAHDAALRRKRDAEASVKYYERGIARIRDAWAGTGRDGLEFVPDGHLYAADLDIFGNGSLFELLCTVQTRAGEQALTTWLLAPAEPSTIRGRQEAVEELRSKVDLREQLALLGNDVRHATRPGALIAWSEAPTVLQGRALLWLARCCALGSTIGLLAVLAGAGGGTPLAAGLGILALFGLVAGGVLLVFRNSLGQELSQLPSLEDELRVLSDVLRRLEAEPFTSPLLVELHQRLHVSGAAASTALKRLVSYATWLNAKANQFFAPFAFLFLLDVHVAYAVAAWRRSWGGSLRDWLEAVGELEAVSALAAYAYEHPDDPFPEIVEDGPVFDGIQLGHPLLAQSACVRNDLQFGTSPAALVVSGSNMSGKSTLLRTVGVNVVMALMGGPVRATSLRVSPMVIGATLRIQDSLQQGTSRFYAEITRVGAIVELAGEELPLLFLLDELLAGTNSHDRAIGAAGIIRGLVESGAVGLVTTHDLALASLADSLGQRARNVHFVDEWKDGALQFDYTLRPGVVQKSNALELMRSVGLDIPADDAASGSQSV